MIRRTSFTDHLLSAEDDILSTVLSIEEPPSPQNPRRELALFRLGFRPFFLFGPIFSIFALSYFILWMSGVVGVWPSAWDAMVWHRHEMLFGYAGAIIAGFLFTAVPNWTGHPTPRGMKLALITLLWGAGRAAVFFSGALPATLVAMVDVLFFPACAMGILPALIKARNRRNYFFIVLLALLMAANAMTHSGYATTGVSLGLAIISLMIGIIGGRVIPFFTERPLGLVITRNLRLERFVLISTASALACDVLGLTGTPLGILYVLAALANGWRLSQWKSLKTWRVPLLWVLHLGYAWLVLGLAMRALYYLGSGVPITVAAHAFTTGAIGTLTLGMMSRVSLGHSGRPLAVGRAITIAFVCVNLAAAFRVFGVWAFPSMTVLWYQGSALCWLLAFAIYSVIYAPILIRPRLDGKDG
jgi:uncharacterized protein involved in response to NO